MLSQTELNLIESFVAQTNTILADRNSGSFIFHSNPTNGNPPAIFNGRVYFSVEFSGSTLSSIFLGFGGVFARHVDAEIVNNSVSSEDVTFSVETIKLLIEQLAELQGV